MKIQQKKYSISNGWETLNTIPFTAGSCNLVLAFGSTSILENPPIYEQTRENYPNAAIVINSTAGEIYDLQVNDDTISHTAVCF